MIHVIATIELAPGTRDAFLAEFRKVVSPVRAEAGCIEYGPTLDVDSGLGAQVMIGDDRVVVVEKWDSVEALKAHVVAPHMLAYRAAVKEFVLRTELRVLGPA